MGEISTGAGHPRSREKIPCHCGYPGFPGSSGEKKKRPMAFEVSQLTFNSDKHRLLIVLNIKQLLQPRGILFFCENNRDIKKPAASQT